MMSLCRRFDWVLMGDLKKIDFNYRRELAAFLRRGFKFPFCPASVLLGGACMDCPLKSDCVRCNPGNLLGIDHQTLTKDGEGNERFTFRPYRAAWGEGQRKALRDFCAYFKLKLEMSDEVTYGEGTCTVYITPTEQSLRFRKRGSVMGQPWYGKDSPHDRYRNKVRQR